MTLSRLELEGIRKDQNDQHDAECIVWRETSPGTVDRNTGQFMGPTTVTIYSGPCSVAPIVSRRDRFDVHGEQQIYQNQYRALLPWDAFDIRIGDYFRVTSSEDDDLDLRDMEVKDVLLVSDTSQRRLTLIDIKE